MAWDSAKLIGKNTADNQVSTTNVTSDADGSVLERLEFLQVAVGGAAMQLITTQSGSNAVEENAIMQFNIGIFDVDSGAIASGDIDITSITNVMQKSTGGGAFATGTQTQPVFSKANGSVYCAYQFLAAEWQAGDMYKLTVTGITADIAGDTSYVPDMVWSNVVTELEALEDYVLSIPASTGSQTWNGTALAAIETQANDALVDEGLDHLVIAGDGGTNAYPDSVAQESIIAYMLSKSADPVTTSYDNTTDSMEMTSDKLGAYTGDGGADYNDSVKSAIEKMSTFVADGDGDMATGTALASNKSIIDALGADGTSAVSNDFSFGSIHQFLRGFHGILRILFVIPEAVGSINADNVVLQTELAKLAGVSTITQADLLAHAELASTTLCVLGTTTSVAWTTSNLADLKSTPNLPILCVDKVSAAYLEIGTDGGDASTKTAINAVSTIEGSFLGLGAGGWTGLAAGANTVSTSATYHTLDMSDADLTETWYAYESVNANTDVVLGGVYHVRNDGTTGIDEEGLTCHNYSAS